ncbi:hypothetical protein GW17_00042967 [Ensete ventricosum]|nr:hypothetical protein GW17_00042967 [Ensete ventricosum]
MMGLRPSRFFRSLVERPPTIVPKMLQRANQHIVAEALVAGRHKESHKRSRSEQSRGQSLRPPRRRYDRPEPSFLGPRPPDQGERVFEGAYRGHLEQYLYKPRESSPCPHGPVEK